MRCLLCHIIHKKIWLVSGDEEPDAQLTSSVTRLSAEGKFNIVEIQFCLETEIVTVF